jgi:hypothetical protein
MIENARVEELKEEMPVIAQKEETHNTIWSGFITKSKQNRVGVDALLVSGDEAIL